MNDELKKLIEESSTREYTIETTKRRISELNEMKRKYPVKAKLYDKLIDANNFLINLKNEIQ